MTHAHLDATTQSQAFEAMVSPHLTALSTLAWQLTRDPVHGEDLVQETLLKAYRFLHRFELGTNFRAWLMTMMRHLYFSQLRKQAREVLTEHLEYIPATAPSELEANADTDRLTTMMPCPMWSPTRSTMLSRRYRKRIERQSCWPMFWIIRIRRWRILWNARSAP